MEVTNVVSAASRGGDSFRPIAFRLIANVARPFIRDGRPPSSDERLLIIRPDHLGDILFTTPALRLLREHFPKAQITYLVGPWAASIVERNPHVDEVLYCDFPWFDGRPRATFWQPYALLLSTARRLRALHFGAAVNLRFDFWWGAALAYFAGIPSRVGYGTPNCRPFLDPAVPYKAGRHEVAQNALLANHLVSLLQGKRDCSRRDYINQDFGPLEFAITHEERSFVEPYLASKGVAPGERYLIIHPGTRAAVKRWSEDGFAAVAAAISSHLGIPVLITGTASERLAASAIAERTAARAIVAAGDTTLGQLAALFERAALVLGVDSGPLHLAAAIGRPTVHLFGPSDHIAFGPYGDPKLHAVVRAGLECSPCHCLDWPKADLPDHHCMAEITVEQVLQAAERVLEGMCLRDR